MKRNERILDGQNKGIVAALMADHRRVEALFELIQACGEDDSARAAELTLDLKKELMVHSNVEDKVVYMFLERHPEFEETIEHAREEHGDIEELLMQLDENEPGDREWRKTIKELEETVQHHVEEEEGHILPSAQKILDSQTSEQLAAKFEQEKVAELETLLETEPSLEGPAAQDLRS